MGLREEESELTVSSAKGQGGNLNPGLLTPSLWDRVSCSGCLSLLLSASPHQVPERKPGLLPRPWKAPFAGGFSPAKGHTFTGPRPKAVRVDHSPWGTDTSPSPHVWDG